MVLASCFGQLESVRISSRPRHLPDLSALSVVLPSGLIALVHLEPSPTAPGPVELVGSIEGGASAARWSPDAELLALITASRNLLLMTKEWDVLYETPIPESVPYVFACSSLPCGSQCASRPRLTVALLATAPQSATRSRGGATASSS